MKLHKGIQIILVACGIIALAACSTGPKKNASAINDANAAYANGAEASGLGSESRFGDQAEGDQLLSKRLYHFDYDRYVVRDEDKPSIEANANYLVSHPNAKILLEGHTDPRGSREYNIGLGERRAKAVSEILIAKGVKPSQIRVVSYGAEKLAATGRSEADYQQDRRAYIAFSQS